MANHSEILARYHIEPKKSLGQNFLIQDGILEKIAAMAEITGKHVIEVWPGYGALTEKLLQKNPASLTLVEYDTKMVEILKDRQARSELKIGVWTDFYIHQGDVLDFHPTKESIVVANIPYYITSPIIYRFLYTVEHAPTEMIILLQKEVGDKIRCAQGFKASYLSMSCIRKCTSITEEIKVAPGNFFPPPKVDSSVLRFVVKKNTGILQKWWSSITQLNEKSISDELFLAVISRGFAHPRKFVLSNLADGNPEVKESIRKVFEELHISEMARPAELSIENWEHLAGCGDWFGDDVKK